MFASKDQFFTRTSGYNITKSLRFRSSASAYFNRTFGTPTLNTKWTVSVWCKKSGVSVGQNILGTSGVGEGVQLRFDAGDTLSVSTDTGGSSYTATSNPLYRDPSAWYHIVISVDTTQATAANRLTVYVNGTAITWSSFAVCPQNTNTAWNKSGIIGYLGSYDNTPIRPFNGYMAEVISVDGQALTPSSFGAIDANGVWSPIQYTGTYGNNGFYLAFTDNSGATATTIGKDYSGNGNNWTPNNISVTAGVTYDSMIDSPTNAASATQPVGNYAVMNPLDLSNGSTTSTATFNSANLNVTSAGSNQAALATFGVSSGKWYWECSFSGTMTGGVCGIAKSTVTRNSYVGIDTVGWAILLGYSCAKINNDSGGGFGTSYIGTSAASGDIIGCALDMNTGKVWWRCSSVSSNAWGGAAGGDPVAGTGEAFSGLTGPIFPAVDGDSRGTMSVNFGQRPFTYTPPSGYQALCTSNLTTPTISNGALYMAATTYTGTGATQTIANTVNSKSFKPDLVWIKSRSAATNNNLFDAIRGTTNYLISNSTAANASNANTLTAFGSTGFTLGSDASSIGVNVNAATYVGWQWLAGAGTTSSNTSGSITSTVCVNTTSGFSVVTYTGTGANATVGHGLGVAPSMVIVKQRTAASTTNWAVWHTSIANTNYLLLNTTAASTAGATYWNSTTPTSSVFSLGSAGDTNTNTGTYVAYCFAPITGFSAFGSYTGNGSSDGPFVYCGFRPRFVLLKITSAIGDWVIYDTSRNPYNVEDLYLYPNSSAAEAGSGTPRVDIISNGFKLRQSGQDNTASATYIYAAFAENPFSIARAR